MLCIHYTLTVPGSDERKLKASLRLKPDILTYDLEDSVPLSKKAAARELVLSALEVSNIVAIYLL